MSRAWHDISDRMIGISNEIARLRGKLYDMNPEDEQFESTSKRLEELEEELALEEQALNDDYQNRWE